MSYSATPALVHAAPEHSIGDLLSDHAEATPERVLIEKLIDGAWQPITALQFHEQATSLAQGLIANGIEPGDRVAIMARTVAEWVIFDFAIWYAGAVTVPIYETSSIDQAAHILNDSEVKAVLVEHAEHAKTIASAREDSPTVEHVWTLTDSGFDQIVAAGTRVDPAQVKDRRDATSLEDLATIIYTSGTTGRPKGAELTHGNFVELAANAEAALGKEIMHSQARTLLFMPLAHVFARFIAVLCVSVGQPQGHTADPANLVRDIGSFKPTFILSVPRVFEKVYNSAEAKAASGGKVKIFRWAAQVARDYSASLDQGGPGVFLKFTHRIADKLVLHKLREVLGGRVEFAISGGAPLGERLGHFYRGVGLTVLEGYGLTETTAPVSVNVPAKTKMGTVGPPLPGVELSIAQDGEILTKGVPVFRGYHGNQDATDAALEDGWFHTGDIGEIDDEGYLKITGRKKEIIVTAGGKNVVPSQLEDLLRGHPLVSQCVVVGDRKPFVAVLITLDAEMLPGWLKNHDLPDDLSVNDAARHPRVLEALQAAIDRTNEKVSRAESIRRFEVLDTDFTVENDYLTPSMKVKRAQVLRDFDQLIEDLYARAAAERGSNNGG